MTPTELEYVATLEQRLEKLERNRFSRLTRSSLLVVPLLAIAMLTGSTPGNGLAALESRLFELESRFRVGSSGSTQMRMPFEVIDARGKVLFSVSDKPSDAAVNVLRQDGLPLLTLTNRTSTEAVHLLVAPNGAGRVATYDTDATLAATLSEAGLNVYNENNKRVAGVTRGAPSGGHGRVVVWKDDDQTAAELSLDARGNGRVFVYGANAKLRSGMYGEGGISVFDDNEKRVVSISTQNGRGAIGVGKGGITQMMAEMTVDSGGGGLLHMKAPDGKTTIGLYSSRRTIALGNSQGKTVAEMTVNPTGNGLFQIWAGGNMPLALMGKSAEQDGGIVQISNGKTVISSFTVSQGGNGYWQLNDASGTPMVEAGLDNGRGTVRAGPRVLCKPVQNNMLVNRLPDCIVGRNQ